jgi:type I restriction enzyme S subunit
MNAPQTRAKQRLKYVASLNDEALAEDTNPNFDLSYIDIGNVDSSGTIHNCVNYRFENAPSRARRIVRHGDVIISTVRTYLQAIAPIENPPENLIVSTGFAVVRPRKGVLEPVFCKYILRESEFLAEVEKHSVGVSYPAINASDLGSIFVPLPPLEEQRAIAKMLDAETARLDELIAEKERLLALLAEKRRALITRAVTRGLDAAAPVRESGLQWLGAIPEHWSLMRVKFLVTKIGSGKTPSGGAVSYVTQGIPLIRSQNVRFEGLLLTDVVFIDQETDRQMSNSHVEAGDVLLNITGASIGRCCVVPETVISANVNQHVCILRPKCGSINKHFLNACLGSQVGQFQIALGEEGISREGISFEDIANFFISVPPLEEQRTIVAYIAAETRKLDDLHEVTSRTIGLLKERRAALIAAAVTGRIDVTQARRKPAR